MVQPRQAAQDRREGRPRRRDRAADRL